MQTRLVLLVMLVGCTSQPRMTPSSLREEADAALGGLVPRARIVGVKEQHHTAGDRMRFYGIPGASIALIEGNKVRWATAFGEASSGNPVSPQTPFMTKSLSKPLTAMAVLRLAERGVFRLDAPIDSLLVRWHIPRDTLLTPNAPTIRQTLNHSGGFNMFGVPSYEPNVPLPTLIEALSGIPPAPRPGVRLVSAPGARTSYSGGGYSVLQALVEDVTRDSFPHAMRGLVLDPLGMDASGFYVGMPSSLEPIAAVGHRRSGQPLQYRWEGVVQMAAGGLVSNVGDLAKYVIEINRAWNGQSKLLSQSSAREALAPTRGWGLGLEISGNGDSLSFSHTGSGDGFKAVLVGFPRTGQGAVILTNADAGGEFRYEVLRSLARAYGWPGYAQVERVATQPDARAVDGIVGKYQFSDKSHAEIMRDTAGTFSFKWGTQPLVTFWMESDSVLFNSANEELRFSARSATRFLTVTWSGSFGAFTAERVAP